MSVKNIFIVSLLLIPLLTMSAEAQQGDDVYNFAVRPGMSEWKELKTHGEMLRVLQLPSNILNSISTRALVRTCLNYPLFPEMWAYDNIKEGFEQLRKDFNGFDELLKRKDALEELLNTYKIMDPDLINGKSSMLDKGRYIIEFNEMEIILAQTKLINEMSLNEKIALLKEVINKHEKMLNYNEFDNSSIKSNVFTMGNILVNTDFTFNQKIKQNNRINDFINTSKFLNKDVILSIISLSKEYLDKQ